MRVCPTWIVSCLWEWVTYCYCGVFSSWTVGKMSADLQWMMIRNNSCFLMKRKAVKQFSKVKFCVMYCVVIGVSVNAYWCWSTYSCDIVPTVSGNITYFRRMLSPIGKNARVPCYIWFISMWCRCYKQKQLHGLFLKCCLILHCRAKNCTFLSASLYFSKRGTYWDRLCRDVVGHWSLVSWLVVTRVHCGQTVHPRPIVTMEH